MRLLVPALTLIALMLATGSAEAATLRAGPMVGAVAHRQVKIWVQADAAANIEIEYWDGDKHAFRPITHAIRVGEETDHVAHFTIGTLEPGRSYRYRVKIDGVTQNVPETLSFKTQALWQWRTDAPNWKLALGSCNYVNDPPYDRPGKPYGGTPELKQIYASIASQKPDLMLWGGDYLYFREVDQESETGMRYRWQFDRGIPEVQTLLRTGSHAAIWDDHEYGPNDANSSYVLKGEALKLFKRYWANASYGLPELPGTFGNFTYNDVEFFLLDGRYHRDSDKLKSDDKAYLGAAQLRWLKNALLASVSPIKIIVIGSQITNDASRSEGWHHFPRERAEFMQFLLDQKINGVVLLSGDRHFTELLKTERAGAYPLYELTCSPLLAGPGGSAHERANPRIVPGTFVAERNFCTIEFGGAKDNRKLTVQSFSTTGEKKWQQEIGVGEISFAVAK